MKRFIASILSAAMLLNGLAPAYAAAEQDGKKSATVKHFTFTADVIPGKLEELEQYDVSMIDHGDVLENEEGVVVSEILSKPEAHAIFAFGDELCVCADHAG